MGRIASVPIALLLTAMPASAETLRVEVLTGALVQPTSVYMHQATGLAVYVPLWSGNGFVQASGMARPEHQSAGYGGSDQIWSLTLGAATPLSLGRFHAGIGLGNASGYVRKLGSNPNSNTSSYSQNTLNVAMGYTLTLLGFISLGLRHETAIGIGDERQRKALVSWPFHSYSFALGVSI